MRSKTQAESRPVGGTAAALLLALVLVGGCETGVGPSPSPSAAPASTTAPTSTPGAPPASAPASAAAPSPTAAPSPSAAADGPLVPGAVAVTVTDRLRVRSQPRVANDSLRLEPVLPVGTQLVLTAGPVAASGYTWFRVAPIGMTLAGGVDQGWVAVADHDGTPWVTPASDATPGFELASATLARRKPDLAAAKTEAAALNAFGVALYRQMLRDPSLALAAKGVAVSPASIVMALEMARAGALGATASEMDATLHAPGWDRASAGVGSLDQLLRSRDAAWVDYDKGQHWLSLRIANMAFGQRGFALDPDYLDRIGRTFGSGLGLVDYLADPAAAVDAINGWVGRQTLGRIPTLLGPTDVTAATRLVLVNAVYLKAEWARPFEPDLTKSRTFTTLAGTKVTVPTMTETGDQDITLARGKGWQATELRYAGPGGTTPLSMTLILPDDLAAFEASLSPATLSQVTTQIAAEAKRQAKVTEGSSPEDCGTYPYDVQVFLPRFGIDTRAELANSLVALGMRRAFDAGQADFSGITAADRLHIGVVVHQANIDVDEQGTEAAAATAVGMDTGGCTGPMPRTTKTLRFDRPFLYLLRDVQTGAILFMGRVVDPTQR